MMDGRPKGFWKQYNGDSSKDNVKSTREATDTPGWAKFVGRMDGDSYYGLGKCFRPDGTVFTAEWKDNKLVQGEVSELQADGKRKVSRVKYDVEADIKKRVAFYDQQPVEKQLLHFIEAKHNNQFDSDNISRRVLQDLEHKRFTA
jgi:uncharacterized Zn finger protein (UPF0148 family)